MRESSGVAAGLTSLPSGGGGAAPLGDRFEPDLVRGSGSYAVPINCPKGPNDLQPALSLTYSTGSGNGPFGLGWRLGAMRIERQSDRGIPSYTDDDTFVIANAEELVPVGGGRYRPKVDNKGWFIERLDEGWRIRTGDGRTMLLGTTAEGRESSGDRDFAWCLQEERDAAGNRIEYTYRRDGSRLYLDALRYSIFSVRFVYDARPDVLRNGRCGFARLTTLRATSIELHCERLAPTLMRTYALTYTQAQNGASLLSRVILSATQGGEVAALPELAFDYTAIDFTNWRIHEPSALVAPPSLDDSTTQLVDMTGDGLPDVLQTAGSRMLLWRNDGGGSFDGPTVVDGVPSIVNLDRGNVAFADLNGDGRVDLFAVDQPLQLAFQSNGAGGFESEPIIFRDRPNLRLSAGNTRLMDLDGDGVTDLITTGRQSFLLYPHKPGLGWQEPAEVTRIPDLERFPDVAFGERGVRLTDMTGDGLQDFVSVQSANVCYWPYLGNGVWANRVEMDRSPVLPAGYREDRLHVVDLDGDGCSDIVYLDTDRTLIWLNQSGAGFAAPIEIPIAVNSSARVIPADLFGDGREGFAWTSTATRADSAGYRFLRFDGGQMPYLMRTVRNGMGKTIETEYATSTAVRLEDRAAGKPWPGQLPFVVHVVRTIHEQDSVTGAATRLSIHYHDGVYDGPRREFRGFSTVTMEMAGDDSMPTSRQEHQFFQGNPDEIDLVRRERERALSGSLQTVKAFERVGDSDVLRSESTHTWDVRVEFSDGDRRVLFPFLSKTETREHSPTLAPQRVERISLLDYDAHGSVGRRVRECFAEGAAPADIIRTEERTTFTNNEAAWLVKLPVRQELRAGDGVPFGVVLNFYDGPAFEGLPEGQVTQGLVSRTRELALLESRLPADYLGGRNFTALGYQLMGAGEVRGFYATTLAVKRDAKGNVVEQRDPVGAPFTTAYDGDGVYPVKTTDARGRSTTFAFDPRSGDPARIAISDGRTMRAEYDAIGRLVAHFVSDDGGQEQLLKRWVVDTVSIPNSITSFAPRQGGHQPTDFTAATNLAALADAAVLRIYYDGFGNRAQQIATAPGTPAGARRFASAQTERNQRKLTKVEHATTFVADFAFTPLAPADASTVRYRYDFRGNVKETAGPGPAHFRVVRDTFALRHHEGDAAGVVGADDTPFPPTRIEHFDARDRVFKIDEARGDGTFVSINYDLTVDGRIEVIHDGAGGEIGRYTFAGPGGPLRISHRDAGTRTYYRDAAGRVVELVYADGARVFYTYDDAGLLVRMEHAPANVQARTTLREYFYDRDPDRPAEDRFLIGRLAMIREPQAEFRYGYNRAGQTVREETTVEGTTLVTVREFDLQGSLVAMTYPDGRRLEYERDVSGAIQKIPGIVTTVAYAADGSVEGYAFANGVEVTLPRDPVSRRLREISARKGATPLRHLEYSFDTIGNITGLHDEIAGNVEHQTFAYDGLYRLTHFDTHRDRANGTLLRSGTYAYDDEGNLQQLEEAGLLRLEYGDAGHAGRLTAVRDGAASQPVTYDARGHVAAFAGMEMALDALDRVVRVTKSDGTDIRLRSDPQNRRVLKQVTRGSVVRRVRYATHVYEQHDDHAVRHVYLSNQLVASERVVGNAATPEFFVSDHHGTILLTTDNAGAVIQQQRYSPFGLASNLSATLDRYLGHERDVETGLLHLGMRCYAPQLGRFLSPDWFVLENPDKPMRMPQGFNLYSYSLNNPLVFKDPSGKWFFIPFVVGFVAGLIYGAADGRDGDATWSLAKETALTVGVGVWGGWATGMFLGGPFLGMLGGFMGGLNGLFAGTRQIYDDIQFGGAEGWASLISDSTWGLIGTSIGNVLNVVNLIKAPSSYRSDLSKGQNRQVYDRGFAFGDTAFTQGNTISNLNRGLPDGGKDKMKILDHETAHIMQNRIFGPVFTVTYAVWFVVGGAVGLGIALFSGEDAGEAFVEVGHDDNPFELWAYEVGGESRNKGKLAL